MTEAHRNVIVRNTCEEDFVAILEMCREVYPASPPWRLEQLSSHLRIFPEGQFVAVEAPPEQVVGMAASLTVLWDDYEMSASWRDFTDRGMFTNHDPVHGRTLYGAEVMVRPAVQGRGVGSKLYHARQALAQRLGLLRIRAGARLRNYHRYANHLNPEEYVTRVVNGDLSDPTLSFQLKRGFHVLAVVSDYLLHDPESLGHAAVIEWINPLVSTPEDYRGRDPRFAPRGRPLSVSSPP
jgi:GNAT superfamily N-acetyltransferase